MIVDRIILKNFKRFRDQEIRFKDGVTGILGNNGSGKSSIVEAIFFGLYGVQSTGISPDYIVSSFASPRERCEVRLDFRIGGEDFTVRRCFRKGKTTLHDARFYKGGKLRATGVNQVENEVRRTLGMGPADFRNTVYAAQKDLLTLLEHTAGKRKEWFLRALGIDYLKTESDRLLKERIDATDHELQSLTGELKALIGRQDPDELNNLQTSVNTFNAELRNLEQIIKTHTERKALVTRELQQFLDKKTDLTRLIERHTSISRETDDLLKQKRSLILQLRDLPGAEKEYHTLEKALSSFEEKRSNLENLRRLKSEYERLAAEIQFTGREYEDLVRRTEIARTKINGLEKDSVRLASLVREIRSLLSIGQEIPDTGLENTLQSREGEILHAIGTISARLSHLVAERRELVDAYTAIQGAGADGVCPLCHQKLGTHYGMIEKEFSTRLSQIEEEALQVYTEQERITTEKDLISSQKPKLLEIRSIVERGKNRDHLEAELRDLHTALQEKKVCQKALLTRIQELGYNEAAYTKAWSEVAELETIQVRYIELGKKIAHGAALRSQETDIDGQIQKKEGEVARLESRIKQADFNPEEGARLEQERAGIDAVIRSAEAERAGTFERLMNTEEKIARHKKDEASIAELRQLIGKQKEEIDLLRLTRTLIGEYVLYLMQVVRSRIEGEVSRIISEITAGRYDQVLLDEDFNLLIRDIDNDYPIDRFSGGEQDDIAVALRIALSRYLAELHQVHESTLLIFDEIFGSQDEERRVNLLTALRTQESRFPQIILISHIPDIQGEFSNTLMVEMGTDLASIVREVT